MRSFHLARVLPAVWALLFILLMSCVCQGCVRTEDTSPTAAASATASASTTATLPPLPMPSLTPRGALNMLLQAKTAPENRFLYLTVWSFQLAAPGDMLYYARQAKKAGFDGIGLIITWDRIEAHKDRFDWAWLDEVLDYVVQEDLKLALGLMFWTGGLSWNQELCLQQTEAGTIYIYDQLRGPLICLNDAATLSEVREALIAWTEHTMQRYGDRIEKYSAHFSAFGEVEYTPADVALDFSPSDQEAFRAFMHAREGGLAQINADYALSLASWEEFDQLPVTSLLARSDYDWQRFHLQTLININRLVTEAVHAKAPAKLVAMQVGSVWDAAAAGQRGVFDPYLISRDVDILHIDDAPGWPHDFSLDMAESLAPGRLIAQELDGAQHTRAIPDLYLRQARMTGESGATIMNTANWSWQALIERREQLFAQYPALFKQGQVRPLAPQDRAILYNTADFISRNPRESQAFALEGAYRALGNDGALRVRFISDSMLLENPALLNELAAGLFLGYGTTMHFDARVADILAEASCPLYAENTRMSLKDPYGNSLPEDLGERLLAKIQKANY